MRHRLLTLLLGIAVASRADAQGFLGRWEVRNAQGGITSLVLTDGGGGKLGGTFSGNGNSFEVTGSAAGEEASGSIAGRGMALFFQAHVKGNTLLLVVAEPGPGGVPNLSSAQQVILNRATDDAMSAAPARPSAAAASPSARPSAVAGVTVRRIGTVVRPPRRLTRERRRPAWPDLRASARRCPRRSAVAAAPHRLPIPSRCRAARPPARSRTAPRR